MNLVVLMGRIGQDPELKVTAGGQAVLKFSLATSEKFKDKAGELQEKTQWHRCVMWGSRAESLSKHLTKGSQILVNGTIEYGSYEKEGAGKVYTTDIKVFNLEFAGSKGVGSSEDRPARAPSTPSTPAPTDDFGGAVGDDEIPF